MIKREGDNLKLVVTGLSCGDVTDRIDALIALLKAARLEEVTPLDRHLVLSMIEEHVAGICVCMPPQN